MEKIIFVAVLSLLVLFFLAACKSGITGSVPKEAPKDIPPNSIQICIGGDSNNCQIIQLNKTDNADNNNGNGSAGNNS